MARAPGGQLLIETSERQAARAVETVAIVPARSAPCEKGLPVSVDGRALELGAIIDELNHRVGKFGYGRYSGLEHLDRGEKVLEVREMPAAWILLKTLRHLETACLSERLVREKMNVEQTG